MYSVYCGPLYIAYFSIVWLVEEGILYELMRSMLSVHPYTSALCALSYTDWYDTIAGFITWITRNVYKRIVVQVFSSTSRCGLIRYHGPELY